VKNIVGYLRLMRLANIITAISDVLAGVAVAGTLIAAVYSGLSTDAELSLGKLILRGGTPETFRTILFLVLSTCGLYGGGVVLNDVFDAQLDKKERPERPIPSGLISKTSAAIFGTILLLLGILFAALSAPGNLFSQSTVIAIIIAFASVIYDKWSKHHGFFGPLNMGICRGLNLLLGMSVVAFSIQVFWYLALIPVIYIAAITMISRGEVHGGSKKTLYYAAFLYTVVALSLAIVSYLNGNLTKSLPFILLFCLLIFAPLQDAIRKPEGRNIGKAVKGGVIALILMNASWAAAFGDMIFAGIILVLLPVSWLFARAFAVT
jgi:4-hydroxybenzoate polyprenyltransferase